MRIKVSIQHSCSCKNINVQNILYRYSEKLPVIHFVCHKKYEDTFRNSTIIFHDKHGKEMFRSSNIRCEFRFYESDTRENKVKMVVRNLEFENYGLLSNDYTRKILSKSCNARVVNHKPIPFIKPKLSIYGIGVLRYMENTWATKRKGSTFQMTMKILKYISSKLKILHITEYVPSVAPT